jgi:heptosyltransferase-3
MNRILVIRGGAIGDFILTLPALKALRDAYPKTHIEILGYQHIAALAENRFYAQAIRSIEYGPMSGFFARDSELSPELVSYFSSFDLIISYLYDPDGIFENNLRHCRVRQIVGGPAKIALAAERPFTSARQRSDQKNHEAAVASMDKILPSDPFTR